MTECAVSDSGKRHLQRSVAGRRKQLCAPVHLSLANSIPGRRARCRVKVHGQHPSATPTPSKVLRSCWRCFLFEARGTCLVVIGRPGPHRCYRPRPQCPRSRVVWKEGVCVMIELHVRARLVSERLDKMKICDSWCRMAGYDRLWSNLPGACRFLGNSNHTHYPIRRGSTSRDVRRCRATCLHLTRLGVDTNTAATSQMFCFMRLADTIGRS